MIKQNLKHMCFPCTFCFFTKISFPDRLRGSIWRLVPGLDPGNEGTDEDGGLGAMPGAHGEAWRNR